VPDLEPTPCPLPPLTEPKGIVLSGVAGTERALTPPITPSPTNPRGEERRETIGEWVCPIAVADAEIKFPPISFDGVKL
jgi:hypothetical protein